VVVSDERGSTVKPETRTLNPEAGGKKMGSLISNTVSGEKTAGKAPGSDDF